MRPLWPVFLLLHQKTYTEEELNAKLTRRVQKAARRQAKQEELKRLHRAQVTGNFGAPLVSLVLCHQADICGFELNCFHNFWKNCNKFGDLITFKGKYLQKAQLYFVFSAN